MRAVVDYAKRINEIVLFNWHDCRKLLSVSAIEADLIGQSEHLSAVARDLQRFWDRSTAVSSAPARAKLIVSVPMPQPISNTRLPFQRAKSAKDGICGSTRYLRAST